MCYSLSILPLNQLSLGYHLDSPPIQKLLLINARSVKNKIVVIHEHSLGEYVDLACITETRLVLSAGLVFPQCTLQALQHQQMLNDGGGGLAVVLSE